MCVRACVCAFERLETLSLSLYVGLCGVKQQRLYKLQKFLFLSICDFKFFFVVFGLTVDSLSGVFFLFSFK